MALRFSGRFNVMLVTRPEVSIFTVFSSMLLHYRSCVLSGDVVGHTPYRVERLHDRGIHAAPVERLQHALSRDVADQHVLRERTSAESADGGIEAAASGVEGSQHFFDGL